MTKPNHEIIRVNKSPRRPLSGRSALHQHAPCLFFFFREVACPRAISVDQTGKRSQTQRNHTSVRPSVVVRKNVGQVYGPVGGGAAYVNTNFDGLDLFHLELEATTTAKTTVSVAKLLARRQLICLGWVLGIGRRSFCDCLV